MSCHEGASGWPRYDRCRRQGVEAGVQPEHKDEGVSSGIKESNWPWPVQVVGETERNRQKHESVTASGMVEFSLADQRIDLHQ